jgi:hypothetical protein
MQYVCHTPKQECTLRNCSNIETKEKTKVRAKPIGILQSEIDRRGTNIITLNLAKAKMQFTTELKRSEVLQYKTSEDCKRTG